MNHCQQCGAEIPQPEASLFVGTVGGVDISFTSVECPVDLIATTCPVCSAPVYRASIESRECAAGFGPVPLSPLSGIWGGCSGLSGERRKPHPRKSLRERRRMIPR
jgi:hypothetical protein